MAFLQHLVVVLLVVLTSLNASTDAFVIALQNCAQVKTLSSRRQIRAPRGRIESNNSYKQTSVSNRMLSSDDSIDDDSPWYSPVSIPYAAALGLFFGYAALFAPGEFGSQLDNDMIQAYIDNPTSPGLNPIFNVIFNLLGAAPLVLAPLVYVQAVPKKGVPPGPFLAASALAGYGGLGPYMMFRKGPREAPVTRSDLGWIVSNILENKLFNLGVLVLCLYQYYTMVVPLLQDPSGVLSDFQELLQTSKFAAVSSLDLCILTLTGASLIPLDYKYRRPDSENFTLLAATTILLPLLGTALYCAVRPPLPEE